MRWTLPFVVLFAATGCSSASGGRAPILAPASPVRVGPGPGQLALVDVDRDGHLDLVTRHLLGRNVTVLTGDGRGGFAGGARSPIPFDDPPGAMALGDVNRDGLLDLVIASRDGVRERVDVLLGAHDGAFVRAPGAPFTTAPAMQLYKPSVVLADVDEDGRLDVLAANGRRHTVEILLGDGAGGFRPGGVVHLGAGEGVSSFALGDLDADGHLDLVAATSAGVTIRSGDGRGGFPAPTGSALSAPAQPAVRAVADVDGDRRPDIVLGHDDSSLLSVLLNRGSGEFAAAPGSPFDLGKHASAAIVADADRDGVADLVVAIVALKEPFESEVVVLTGPSFVAAPGSPFPAGRGAYNVAVGDVDEDGRLDVAASNWEGDSVVLLLGRR